MNQKQRRKSRSILFRFKFLGTAMVGSLTMALVCTFAELPAQVAILGALVSILGGLFLGYLEQKDERERSLINVLEKLQIPMELAPDHELFDSYVVVCKALTDLAKQADPILREFALVKLAFIREQLESLADGTVVFSCTEAWRTVYDQILKCSDIKEYQSVAWVRTKDYWQDAPGRRSMAANFDAAHRGLLIERAIILPDELWPKDDLLPSEDIRPWIEEQHNHGLCVSLVRETEIRAEPNLLADFGIYGDRAVGVQELDEQCRTLRFVLHFDEQNVKLAKDHWRRISLYAVSYRKLLDQLPPAG